MPFTPTRNFAAYADSDTAGAAPNPDEAANADGYDADVCLAQHLLHDQLVINEFVEKHLPAEEVARVRNALAAEVALSDAGEA